MGDLSVMLKENMARFSKGQKRIAQYLLACSDQAAFFTASQLGAAVQVSESTVIRFAAELGFDGYPSLQRALQQMAICRLRAAPELEMPPQDAASQALQADLELLHRTDAVLDRRALAAGAELMCRARQVYVLGGGAAGALAQLFAQWLQVLLDRVQLVPCGGVIETLENLVRIGPDDVVVSVCMPPYAAAAVQALAYSRSRGAAAIVITDRDDAPAAAGAEIALVACSQYRAPVQSMTAPLSVLQVLTAAVAERRGPALAETQAAVAAIRQQYGLEVVH